MSAGKLFRKKPIVVEAVRFDGSNANEVVNWAQGGWTDRGFWMRHRAVPGDGPRFTLIIPTLEGQMEAMPGDWIIRGVNGEFYPCKPEIFEKTYERAEISA